MEQDLVARPLAIEGEAGAVMADLDDARRALDPAERRRAGRRAARRRPAQTAGRSGFSAKVAVRSISISS